jgi:hypothetical protein
MADERLMRLRYDGVCARCGEELKASMRGWWEGERKTVRCERCGPAAPPSPKAPAFDVSAEPNVGGASAQREFERRRKRREDDMRQRHPRIGGLILGLTNEPQSTKAWAQGAVGEERVGLRLDRLTEIGAVVLHDRRIPRSRANIDHVVVAPSGVWVIDTKHYDGKVELRNRGVWFRRDDHLFVKGHDQTKLVVAMTTQMNAVASAVADAIVPLYPVLCFTGAEWGLLAQPFVIDGVLVTWPRALVKTVTQSSGRDIAVPEVAARLATALPAGTRPAARNSSWRSSSRRGQRS